MSEPTMSLIVASYSSHSNARVQSGGLPSKGSVRVDAKHNAGVPVLQHELQLWETTSSRSAWWVLQVWEV